MSQGPKSPHEDFIMFFLVVFIVGGVCWAIWHFFHAQLTEFVRYTRRGELYIDYLMFGNDKAVSTPDFVGESVGSWRAFMKGARNADITPAMIVRSTYVAVVPLRYLFAGIMGLFALWAMLRGPGTQYHRRMNLQGLMEEQAKSFPVIQPFLKFDPRKLPFRAPGQPVPKKLPLFSEALSPEEWLAYHQVGYANGQVDVNRAYRALALQLGKRWQGPFKLPLYAQGLFAAFALKHVRKRKDSYEMINDLARSWTPEGGFKPSPKLRAQIRAVIKDPKVGGALQKYADQHAYETTALLRCLARAREEGGVLAPAEFLWLRGQDRDLWYPLNNLGRKSYCAEAAGALVHFTNELIAGQKIPTPRFEEVIRGMEEFMKSGSGRAVPQREG